MLTHDEVLVQSRSASQWFRLVLYIDVSVRLPHHLILGFAHHLRRRSIALCCQAFARAVILACRLDLLLGDSLALASDLRFRLINGAKDAMGILTCCAILLREEQAVTLLQGNAMATSNC